MVLRRAMRAVCALIQHDWAPPVRTQEASHRLDRIDLYRTQCRRCHTVIKGDWDWMEENRAWPHYRRAL